MSNDNADLIERLRVAAWAANPDARTLDDLARISP